MENPVPVNWDHVENAITAKMKQEGISRPEAIDELLAGAEKGAQRAEAEITLAKDALSRAKTEEETEALNAVIIRESDFAARERERTIFFKEAAKLEAKKQP